MGVDNNIEINNNLCLKEQTDLPHGRSETKQSTSSKNIVTTDSFIPKTDTSKYDYALSTISLFSLSGAVPLLRNIRDEKDPAVRNAVVKQLINKIFNELFEMYRLGFILMSKDSLRRLAKQLKEVCKEIDELIKEGLVELDESTMQDYLWIKGFVNFYGDEEENKRGDKKEEEKAKENKISIAKQTTT